MVLSPFLPDNAQWVTMHSGLRMSEIKNAAVASTIMEF